jgi:hypothetical protein
MKEKAGESSHDHFLRKISETIQENGVEKAIKFHLLLQSLLPPDFFPADLT